MKLTKVCILSLYAYQYFNPGTQTKVGGAEQQLYYLSTELAKDRNFEVSFLVGDFGQPDVEVKEQVKLYKFFKRLQKFKYLKAIFAFGKLWGLLKKIDADVYIQRAAGLETGIIAFFCKAYRKKFIYMAAHDEDVSGRKPIWMMSKGLVGLLNWWFFKVGLRLADMVVVQHEEQKRQLKQNYKKESLLRPSAQRMPESEISKRDFIFWVARCENWKQPELFIELAKATPEAQFVMVCPKNGVDGYFNKIKNKAVEVPNLEFIGYLRPDEYDAYFAQALVHVSTSKVEGFPNTFVQAWKGKTPVLSLHANPNGVLDKFPIGRCAHGDFEKLKKDLRELLSDRKLWEEISQNAYFYAKSNHDIRKIVEDDKRLIRSLIS